MPTLTNPFRYETAGDASRRLLETFVRYKGEAAYVMEMLGELSVLIVLMARPGYDSHIHNTNHTSFSKKVHSSDVELDISSPEVGWVNQRMKHDEYRPVYWLRSVDRQYSQGFCPRKNFLFDPNRVGLQEDLLKGYAFSDWNDLIPLAVTIERNVQVPIKSAVEYPFGSPLNRRWALTRKSGTTLFMVYHQAEAIGTFNTKDNTWYFAKDSLTKTRRTELDSILNLPENTGGGYVVQEQL